MMPTPPDIPPAQAPLEYAPRPALPWVNRHWKLLILMALVIAIAIPLYLYWQPLKHRALWLYWSHQAAAFQMPAKAIDLAAPPLPTTMPAKVPTFIPHEYQQLRRYDPRLSLTAYAGEPVAYLGTLHRPDGTPRLVIVTGCNGINSQILARVSVLVLPLPRWTDPLPPAVSRTLGWIVHHTGPPPTPTMLKSGVIDPSDPTHIIFEFEAGPIDTGFGPRPTTWSVSATGIIDAHLQDDDSMSFRLRSFTGRNSNIRVGREIIPGDFQTLQGQAGKLNMPSASSQVLPTTTHSIGR